MYNEPPTFQTRFLSSFDSTRIAYYLTQNSSTEWIMLANGLGGNTGTWRHLTTFFKNSYRFASWDYRGLYMSDRPLDGDYSIEAHARDALEVARALNVKNAVLFGWSMGVQVTLEIWRLRPEFCKALILLDGTYRAPVKTTFGNLQPALLRALDLLATYQTLLRPCARQVARRKATIKLFKLLGLVGQALDEKVFMDLAKEYVNLDFAAYAETFRAMDNYDASSILPTIKVPTLIICGENDLFTPIKLAKEMVDKIPQAQLYVVPRASHYAAVEYPELLNYRIESFLESL